MVNLKCKVILSTSACCRSVGLRVAHEQRLLLEHVHECSNLQRSARMYLERNAPNEARPRGYHPPPEQIAGLFQVMQ